MYSLSPHLNALLSRRISSSMLPSDPSAPGGPAPAANPGPSPSGGLEVPPTPVSPRRSGSRGPILGLALVVVCLLSGIALFMSGYLVGQRSADQPGTPVAAQQSFQPFWDTYDTILKRFAGGTVDRQAMIRGAIKGMVDSLGDPYSAYLTPDEYRQGLQ